MTSPDKLKHMIRMTEAQHNAIERQIRNYGQEATVLRPAYVRHTLRIAGNDLAADFVYRYKDGGEGRETTIFRPDGSVRESQDFG